MLTFMRIKELFYDRCDLAMYFSTVLEYLLTFVIDLETRDFQKIRVLYS